MGLFKLKSEYQPDGDQKQAIEKLVAGLRAGDRYQTLLGVTGSGKTFTMANVIAAFDRPVLIMSHNKTLAAQLYSEFKEFFPENAVEFFVSYYDYYQPEAYVPSSDTYIEKDSSVNDRIDRLRLSATSSLLSRKDTIIVASVSCIYGLGSPEEYQRMTVPFSVGQEIDRAEFLASLVDIQYERNDIEFARGAFRVRGEVIDIFPAYRQEAVRVEFFGDEIESISTIDPLTAQTKERLTSYIIFPAKHFVMTDPVLERAAKSIEAELTGQIKHFEKNGKLLEAQRIEQRTRYDIEMLHEIGYCNGIENYSRHFTGRAPGEPPYNLFDYFPDDFLMIVDESHQSLPQIRGMFNGDRARKQTLVNFGFRLPSALDNRPLMFEEWERKLNQAVFVSATPGPYELQNSAQIVEQLIRPTGLLDPEVEVRPAKNQVDDLIAEVQRITAKNARVLVTTLTKKMAEELTDYLVDLELNVRYLHSDIDTLERIETLKALRTGDCDVIVGINLLREGLDLPEVELVAILDADREGFLRSETSLVQTMGRAARNNAGRVILYADTVTGSMKRAIDETNRRREAQRRHNEEHGITPRTIIKSTDALNIFSLDPIEEEILKEAEFDRLDAGARKDVIEILTAEMEAAADRLDFERAAAIRDKISQIEETPEGVPRSKKKLSDAENKNRKKRNWRKKK